MPLFVSKVLSSPAVRRAFFALVVAALAALGVSLQGCASLPPPKQAELDLFDCRVEAVKPAVEPVLDAAELVRDLYAGRASLGAVLQALDKGEAEVRAVLERLRACDAPELPPTVAS